MRAPIHRRSATSGAVSVRGSAAVVVEAEASGAAESWVEVLAARMGRRHPCRRPER